MLRRILSLAFALCALSLAAQQTPLPPQAPLPAATQKPPVATGRITGTVLCSDTRKPARGADVSLSLVADHDPSHAGHDARVGLDGSYLFEKILPGDYIVQADLDGYTKDTGPDGMPAPGATAAFHITVQNNQVTTQDLTLRRGGAISGHVFFSDGAPAVNAEVDAEGMDGTSNKTGYFRRFIANDLGIFRIRGLVPGRYRVSVMPHLKSEPFSPRQPEPIAMAVFSPGTLHRNEAAIYDLKSGDEVTGIDITIPIAAFHRVSGKVTAKDGRPLQIGTVTLIDDSDPQFTLRTVIDRQGSFSFVAVPTVEYKITASHLALGEPDPRYHGFTNATDVPLVPNIALADATLAIIVKEDDISDLDLTSPNQIPLSAMEASAPYP